MLLSILLLAAVQETPVARDIRAMCGGSAPCIARQKAAARRFLGHVVAFDASDAVTERCMRQGKVGRHLDWLKAERCIKGWSAGRKSRLPGGR